MTKWWHMVKSIVDTVRPCKAVNELRAAHHQAAQELIDAVAQWQDTVVSTRSCAGCTADRRKQAQPVALDRRQKP